MENEKKFRLVKIIDKMIDDGYLDLALKTFSGNIPELKQYLENGEKITNVLIFSIKKILDDIGGTSLSEIGMDNIFYDSEVISGKDEKEYHEISYLGTKGPIVDVWLGFDGNEPVEEYQISYYDLDDNTLYEIYTKINEYYSGF